MGQCPATNLVMSDESCFTDKVVRRKVKKSFLSYRHLKTQAFGKHSKHVLLFTPV